MQNKLAPENADSLRVASLIWTSIGVNVQVLKREIRDSKWNVWNEGSCGWNLDLGFFQSELTNSIVRSSHRPPK
jgi:hypothetical protein